MIGVIGSINGSVITAGVSPPTILLRARVTAIATIERVARKKTFARARASARKSRANRIESAR